MSKRTRTLFLLSFDNGQSWEDHHVSPVLVVDTRTRAEAIVADVDAWVAAKREKLPPCPYEVTCQRIDACQPELTDEEYAVMNDKRQAWIAASRPPHGITDAREMLTSPGASLVIGEIPFHA